MRPTHVYRSTDPDLVAALAKQRDDWLSFSSRCDVWAAQHPMDDQDRKLAAFYGEGAAMRGYFPLDGDDTAYARRVTDAIYPGWKFHRRTGVWVPDTRSDLGKELARTLPRVVGEAAIAERMTGLSTWIKVAGSETREGSYHAGCARITVTDGVAQAECPGDPLANISDSNRETFDRFWSPVKLSDFYAEQGL